MTPPATRVAPLGLSDLEAAVDVVTDAFAGDPLMSYLFEGAPGGIASLARLACGYRLAVGWPVLGVRVEDGTLAGVDTHYLGIVGVRRGLHGRGHGHALLTAIHELAARDPDSAGVWLDTELPANVRWYERQGYRLRAVNRAGPLSVTAMFRPS